MWNLALRGINLVTTVQREKKPAKQWLPSENLNWAHFWWLVCAFCADFTGVLTECYKRENKVKTCTQKILTHRENDLAFHFSTSFKVEFSSTIKYTCEPFLSLAVSLTQLWKRRGLWEVHCRDKMWTPGWETRNVPENEIDTMSTSRSKQVRQCFFLEKRVVSLVSLLSSNVVRQYPIITACYSAQSLVNIFS